MAPHFPSSVCVVAGFGGVGERRPCCIAATSGVSIFGFTGKHLVLTLNTCVEYNKVNILSRTAVSGGSSAEHKKTAVTTWGVAL